MIFLEVSKQRDRYYGSNKISKEDSIAMGDLKYLNKDGVSSSDPHLPSQRFASPSINQSLSIDHNVDQSIVSNQSESKSISKSRNISNSTNQDSPRPCDVKLTN